MPSKKAKAPEQAAPETEALDGNDTECAESRQIEEVAEGLRFDDPYFAVGDCRDSMLQVIRQAVDMSKMREHAQREIIEATSNAAVTIVQKIARAIASEGVENVGMTLDKLVIKDGLQVTLKGPFTHDALAMLGDAQGKMILVSLPDSERFDHSRASPPVHPDQPEMPLIGPEGDTDLVEAAGNREVYRDTDDDTIKVRHRDPGAGLAVAT